jgi:hypothetical protein
LRVGGDAAKCLVHRLPFGTERHRVPEQHRDRARPSHQVDDRSEILPGHPLHLLGPEFVAAAPHVDALHAVAEVEHEVFAELGLLQSRSSGRSQPPLLQADAQHVEEPAEAEIAPRQRRGRAGASTWRSERFQ